MDAERLQDLRDRMHVVERRNLIQTAWGVLPQERRGDDGQYGVLRTADLDAPCEPTAALYNQLFHERFVSSPAHGEFLPAHVLHIAIPSLP